MLRKRGHLSVLEHASFTFGIEGIAAQLQQTYLQGNATVPAGGADNDGPFDANSFDGLRRTVPAANIRALGTDTILEGDFAAARQWHNKLFTLSSALLSLATNPIPIKAAMAMLDMCSDQMRLPLVNLSDDKSRQLRQILSDYGLLR